MPLLYITFHMNSHIMSVVDRVMSFIKGQEGVVGVFEMDDDVSKEIDRIEKSIVTRTNHEYKSVGYEIAMKRRHRLCVFYTNDFTVDMRSRLKLMSSDGTVMGTTLMKDELEEYRKRDDVLWISDDFIVFPEIRGEGDEMFVEGHNAHAGLLEKEANNEVGPLGLLMVHAEDQLMSAEAFKTIALEFIDSYERIEKLEAKVKQLEKQG